MNDQVRKMMGERSLVLVKPDGVMRGLIGKIVARFEDAGFKIVGMKMLVPTRELLDGHFPHTDKEWVRGMGGKTLSTYEQYGVDPKEFFGTEDAEQIGEQILEWNYAYLSSGPVVAMVLEGVHAIDTIRKIIGNTLPFKADPGTIRGDFSINSPALANMVGAAQKNIVHASGDPEEAEQEVANWFSLDELVSYERADEAVHFLS